MENKTVLLEIDGKTFKGFVSEIPGNDTTTQTPNFENDKISIKECCILIGCTPPTLLKLVKSGKLKMYSLLSRKYFLKSEVIEALRK
jgi:hypothetical protein